MSIKEDIRDLANRYAEELRNRIATRIGEMKGDDQSHYLIYAVLGIASEEGKLIDLYQNKGRFLYRYAGAFLEGATVLCFKYKYPEADSMRILNTEGARPKTFQIDCVVGTDAIEIKWRDATTDGDHITKEHTRLQAIRAAGYTPIRVMFYYPNREQAVRIQQTLETLYQGADGQYYYADAAWDYIKSRTGVDLKQILEELAQERADRNGDRNLPR